MFRKRNPVQAAERDIRVLWKFQEIYCHGHHSEEDRQPLLLHGLVRRAVGEDGPRLCADCATTFQHGATKRALCPYDPKPACKHCPTPCYHPGYRTRMRVVMRFSGKYLIKHGRLDLLWKYLF